MMLEGGNDVSVSERNECEYRGKPKLYNSGSSGQHGFQSNERKEKKQTKNFFASDELSVQTWIDGTNRMKLEKKTASTRRVNFFGT